MDENLQDLPKVILSLYLRMVERDIELNNLDELWNYNFASNIANSITQLIVGILLDVIKFDEKDNLINIDVDIICERDSHKGIIIGKDGAMLKKIGERAREDFGGHSKRT